MQANGHFDRRFADLFLENQILYDLKKTNVCLKRLILNSFHLKICESAVIFS